MKTVLFQGDSITDCGRSRDAANKYPGHGYPIGVIGKLGYENPGEYDFHNRAISGNRIVDLYARLKIDILNLKPDIMSILIGVNDVWHDYNPAENKNGVDAEKFGKIYDMLIEEVLETLPNIKIMIMEPYVTHGAAIDPVWDEFRHEVELRAAKAKAVAEKYNLKYVPLQKSFDEAYEKYPVNGFWTAEGVHPTPAGHELIGREWLKAFCEIK